MLAILALALQTGWAGYAATPTTPLEGMWQSCRSIDGAYDERIWAEFADHKAERLLWEFHMGPFNSFGLYLREQADDHNHQDAGNRMLPDNVVSWQDMRRVYTLWEVGLRISISRLVEDRPDCEKFYIRIDKLKESK